MEKLLRNSPTEEKVLMKNGNEKEVIRSVTKEVGVASSVTYDLTLVCKGGATVINSSLSSNEKYHHPDP